MSIYYKTIFNINIIAFIRVFDVFEILIFDSPQNSLYAVWKYKYN